MAKSVSRTIAKWIGVSMVVFIGGFLALAWYGGTLEEPRYSFHETATTFLTQVRDEEVDLAYESTSDAFKKSMTRENFDTFLDSYTIFTTFETVSSSGNARVSNGIGTAQVILENETTTMPIDFEFVEEGGTWRITSFAVARQGEVGQEEQVFQTPQFRDIKIGTGVDGLAEEKTVFTPHETIIIAGGLSDAFANHVLRLRVSSLDPKLLVKTSTVTLDQGYAFTPFYFDFVPKEGMATGEYEFRVDFVGPDGDVLASTKKNVTVVPN